ncbi:restriction endonuclease subunit S [Clostridium sp. ZBS15]|uniref:restriction endonuclease subunit S n=1 Tax=Clostridium sp. ZBS15 TaxID=2949969 RepID=UPI00207A2E68|nr:restriction endonuclease subunit S [Clostridium sp. ZBS15]
MVENIPEGYKKTDVGVIPKDWEVMALGELLKFKNGLNKAKEYFGYGIPIVNYNDVYLNTELKVKDILGKVFLTAKEIKLFEVRKGDVFFTRTSETPEEVGISTVVVEDVKDTVFSGFILRGRPLNNKLDLFYKKYCFDTKAVRDEIVSSCTYTTRALTNGTQLSKINIIIPPIPEQIAIANALSDIDSLIYSLEKLIDKKKNIKQGAMQELLTGKKRLDGFCGEWEEKEIDNICSFINGKAHENSISENGKYTVVNSKFISTNGDIRKFSNECFCLTKQDDILMVMSDVPNGRAIAKCFFVNENDKYTVNQRICILRLENVNSKFIYYLINRHPCLLAFDDGVKQTNLKKTDITSLKIRIPSTIEEQTAIAKILSDMDTEIEKLNKKLNKYKEIKQGMMQELLTGKRRLI